MLIERDVLRRITLRGFADEYGLVLQIKQQSLTRWTARFKHAEVLEGSVLVSEYGDAEDEKSAITDYARKISGQRLVVDAYTPNRREIRVPILVGPGFDPRFT